MPNPASVTVRARGRSNALLLAALVWAGTVFVAHAQELLPDDDKAAYDAEIRDAVRALHEERWRDAYLHFARGHELRPSARTLRGLGIAEYELGGHVAAHLHLSQARVDPRRPLDDAQRAEVERLLERLRASIGRYRVELTPATAQWTVDGADPALDPEGYAVLALGDHRVEATAPEHQPLSRQVTVRGGEQDSLSLQLVPLPPVEPALWAASAVPRRATEDAAPDSSPVAVRPLTRPLWPWIVAGSSGAVVALGVALASVGLRSRSSVEDARDGRRWSSLEDAYDRASIFTPVGFTLAGVALGGVAVGTWAILQREERAPRATLALSPQGVQLRGRY